MKPGAERVFRQRAAESERSWRCCSRSPRRPPRRGPTTSSRATRRARTASTTPGRSVRRQLADGVRASPTLFDFRDDVLVRLAASARRARADARRELQQRRRAFEFTAPAGTTIVAIRANRYDEVRSSADDPNTPDPENGDWARLRSIGDGRPLGRRVRCRSSASPEGPDLCTKGDRRAARTRVRSASSSTSMLPAWASAAEAANLAYVLRQRRRQGFGTTRLASSGSTARRVTLDDNSAPTAALGGDLLVPGLAQADADPLTWAGVRQRRHPPARAAASTARSVARERYSTATPPRPVPCANVAGVAGRARRRSPTAATSSQLVATDSAGNPTTVTQTVDVDGNGADRDPCRARAARRSRSSVSDGASGVAGGTISVRNSTTRAVPRVCRRRSRTAR